MARTLDASDAARSALPLALLAALNSRPLHGYALIDLLNSHGFPGLKGGTLYPLLARLEGQALIASEWHHDSNGPGRKVFTATSTGRTYLHEAVQAWQAMGRTLEHLSSQGSEET